MKKVTALIATAMMMSAGAYAEETTEPQMVQEQTKTQAQHRHMKHNAEGVDELITEMNEAPAQERYRYMNRIKVLLQTMNEEQREEALRTMEQKKEQLRQQHNMQAQQQQQQQQQLQQQQMMMQQQQMQRQQMMPGR